MVASLLYVALYLLGTGIALAYGVPLDRALFESVSAGANVGLSVGLTDATMPVLLKITSRVVYVFFGDGGQGKIVTLEEDHTSLIEALAAAGGISEWGKAYKIKIIRGDLKNPQIFLVDLSTVEGMKKSSLYVQSNDIVYIEQVSNVAAKLMTQLTPFIALLTTVLLTINLLQK